MNSILGIFHERRLDQALRIDSLGHFQVLPEAPVVVG